MSVQENHENETDFVAALQTSPGDFTLLRVDAKRLIQRDDMRGNHLAAVLDVRAIVKLLLHSPLMVAL